MLLPSQKNPGYALVLFFTISFFLVLLVSLAYNEIMPEKYLKVFDEKHYIHNIKAFGYHLDHQTFNRYYNSRLLMPAIVATILKIFEIEKTVGNIRDIFIVLNYIAVGLAYFYFLKITWHKNLGLRTTALGVVLLFFNFFLLKHASFIRY